MSLVPSLLQAIVHVDGEALVMHAGDKPYVVSPAGQVDLATRGLTLEAVNGIVNQLLPPELQKVLDEFGAVQHQLAAPQFAGEQFTVVAARGGDDLWVEIRRRRIPDDDQIPEDLFPPRDVAAPTTAYPVYAAAGSPSLRHPAPAPEPVPAADAIASETTEHAEADLELPEASQIWAGVDAPAAPPDTAAIAAAEASSAAAIDEALNRLAPVASVATPPPDSLDVETASTSHEQEAVETATPSLVAAKSAEPVSPRIDAPAAGHATTPIAPAQPHAPVSRTVAPEPSLPKVEAQAPHPAANAAVTTPRAVDAVPPSGVVVPIARNPIRSEQPTRVVEDPTMSGLDRLLRLSAARGASTLYLSSGSRPSVRVDGELQMLDGERLLSARDVESLLLTLMPERSHEALRTGAATEWILDIEDVGRVRCMSFRDHRGPGGVFRLMPTRTVSAEQLALPKVVQALGIEPEGLVLVAGPRSSGKRTLISAFVDLINRTRRDHVITIEREVNIVHDRGSAFVSQREVRGSDEDLLAAARAALREDPDVLVIEDLRTADLMNVALEAATSGHLVIGGFSAHTATAAMDRIIDLYAPEHRRQVQFALADTLRGVIVQVLLRKVGGGRVAAREVLLNTPAVSSVIAEGKTSQLPLALEGGRRYGMMPLNDALVSLVQQGIVDGREAYRYSTDRSGLLAGLERQGVDTSFVERLA